MALETGIAPNDIEAASPGVQEEMVALLLDRKAAGGSGQAQSALQRRLREFAGG